MARNPIDVHLTYDGARAPTTRPFKGFSRMPLRTTAHWLKWSLRRGSSHHYELTAEADRQRVSVTIHQVRQARPEHSLRPKNTTKFRTRYVVWPQHPLDRGAVSPYLPWVGALAYAQGLIDTYDAAIRLGLASDRERDGW